MASAESERPNIVFILSDDQGPWALGCAGNGEIRTPNLDRIAAEGMRFDSFFCTSPVCSPARASLLTGRIPSAHGVHDWIRGGNVDIDKQREEVRSSSQYQNEHRAIEYLRGMTGYTDVLTDHGYRCGLSGKWHMGDSLSPQKGFSHWFTIGRGGCQYYHPDVVKNGKIILEERYLSDLITEDALDFLEESLRDEAPFYLSAHYTAPHSPWIDNHPKEIVDSYDSCDFATCPVKPDHQWNYGQQPVGNQRRENLKGYFAAVTAMDAGIGKILDKIEKSGLKNGTLICFLSDNGFNCGHHGVWGKGNGTFPLNMYDSSVKVPALFSHPGRIPRGSVTDAMVSGYDFMPTLLDYLDFDNPEAALLPGRSFKAVLEGKSSEARENVVVYDEYGPVRMVRSREWKYVHRFPYGPHELYDLIKDPGETANLVKDPAQSAVIASMKSDLDTWFDRYVDPALDGTHEPVTGSGQRDLAGPAGKGVRAFHQEQRKQGDKNR